MNVVLQILVWTSLIIAPRHTLQNDMEFIRLNYLKSASNKILCQQMIERLERSVKEPVHMAYLGGLRAIWARHVFSPIAKLSSFNKGRKEIETAVSRAPENLEVRLVRLSVQVMSPVFLGYKNKIEEDRRLIEKNINSITSGQLKEMFIKIIRQQN